MKEIIKKYVDITQAKLLKIGAYDRPTFTKEEANIKFLDIQTHEFLSEDAKKWGKNTSSIVEVDYLVHNNIYENEILDKFDVIIADNVFEHISNPIRWLQTLEKLLKNNTISYIFLRIPEYKAIFDKYRYPTTFAHIITDYIRNVPDLDPEHSVELGLYYDYEYSGKQNDIQDRLSMSRIEWDFKNPHFGVHCHTYSADTFVNKIWKPIGHLKILDLSLVELVPEKFAFTIVFKKGAEDIKLTFDEFVSQ